LQPKPRARPSLPFREPTLSLRDILDSIDMIVQFVRGMDLEAFREDPKTIAAVERKLLLISEAAIRLGTEAENLCPGLPWHNIRGIGNWPRHRYDRVDVETVWNTVIDDLPPLRSGVLRALTPPPANPRGRRPAKITSGTRPNRFSVSGKNSPLHMVRQTALVGSGRACADCWWEGDRNRNRFSKRYGVRVDLSVCPASRSHVSDGRCWSKGGEAGLPGLTSAKTELHASTGDRVDIK
jgi:uncharacterized protein with HEPN domain